MANSISERVKYMWEHWNIRVVVQFSLALQILLIGLAPSRKWTSNKFVNLLVWSSCLQMQQQTLQWDSSSMAGAVLLMMYPLLKTVNFWLSGLLFYCCILVVLTPSLHLLLRTTSCGLGICLRSLFRWLLLVMFSFEIFARTSKDKFRASMLRKPDPGINIAKYAELVASKKPEELPEELPEVKTENQREAMVPDAAPDFGLDIRKLEDLDVVQEAHKYFKIFKGLIVDIIYSFEERNKSRDFFNSISAEDAFKVIAAELNFLYDVLYTKVVVVHSMLGMILRFISCSSVLAALATFHFYVKKHGFDPFDVKVTYALLLGAIGLDGVSILMAIFSNWTIVAVLECMPRPEDRSHWVLRLFSKFLILKRSKIKLSKMVIWQKWPEICPKESKIAQAWFAQIVCPNQS